MIRISQINKLLTLLVFLMISWGVQAQAPRISSIEPEKASAGSLVTITGDGFSTDMTKMIVWFGAARGQIVSSTENIIEVTVPAGATYGSLSVTNTTTNLIGYSTRQFLLTYGGKTFDVANLTAPIDFPTSFELFDLCLCDFDGDGKVDVGSASLTTPQPYIFKNTSTGNTPTFSNQRFTVPGVTKAISCIDLNGDGKPEMLLTRGDQISNSFFVLQNTSTTGTISFSSNVQSYFSAEERPVNRLAIRDLDGDGLPEVIATNSFNNSIYIFKNESTPTLVKLNSIPQPVTIVGSTDSFDIEAVDLDGDSKPDLVISPFNKENLYIVKNTTTALNNFTFSNATQIIIAGKFREMVMTELNGDTLPDFVIANSSENKIHLGTNTSTSNTFSFSWTEKTSNQPFSLDCGDLNGDGLGDVLASNLAGTDMKILLNNTVLPSTSPTFQEITVSADAVADQSVLFTRQTKIGDISGDGKPDLLAATWDNTFSKYNLTVIRNKNCVEPILNPVGPLAVCSGQTITMSTVSALEATYVWKIDGVDTGAPSQPTYDYVVDGSSPKITVSVVSEAGSCDILSNEVSITFDPGIAPATPTLSDPAPVCVGSDVTLTGPARAGATFFWRGPNGFTSSVQSPVISSATAEAAGTYYLAIQEGNCLSDEASLFVEIVSPPGAAISTAGSSVICQGQSSITLEVTNVSDFSYQWKLDGSPIAGATGVTHDALQQGSYTVALSSNIASCTVETPAFAVNSVPPPVADFNASASGCVGEVIQFENISTVDGAQTATYLWNFGDGSTGSPDSDPTHGFNAAGTYDVTLTVNYGDATCQDIVTKPISIAASPTITISTPSLELCSSDSLVLKASGTYASLIWSTMETADSIQIFTGGEYYATAMNAEGCEAADTVTIVELPSPEVTITADPGTGINLGESVILSATGGLSYSWTPTASLDNPGVATPMATPDSTTIYQVEVTGENGCVTFAQIEILVGIELNPRKVFSPNGDGIEDDWIIGGIQNMPNCSVVIFDRQGRKVFESQPYNNDWKALTPGGGQLPAGPYYFIIKCDNEVAKTGSVLVVR